MHRRSIVLGALALPLLASCQSVQVEETSVVTGVVETVDPTSRELLLRGNGGAQSGALLSMIVGQHVQRLGQIRPGDRVTVRYYQGLLAQMVHPFSPKSQPFAGMTFDRRETAERPGGEITRVRRGRVTITAVDPATNTVSFVGPRNILHTVVAENPKVQAFLRTLRVGDQVDVVYEEALAISVEPMGSPNA